MIFRRLLASSSFVLAAARLRALQPDPGRAAAGPAAARKDPEEQSAQARRRVVTGSGPYALLTLVALMGAADRVHSRLRKAMGWMGSNLAALSPGAWGGCQPRAGAGGRGV